MSVGLRLKAWKLQEVTAWYGTWPDRDEKAVGAGMEEEEPLSAWQQHQVWQVLQEFPKVLSGKPGTVQWVVHRIPTLPKVVMQMQIRPVPHALKRDIEQEVMKMIELRVIEKTY